MYHSSDDVLKWNDKPHGEKVDKVFNPSIPCTYIPQRREVFIFKGKKANFYSAGLTQYFLSPSSDLILPKHFPT